MASLDTRLTKLEQAKFRASARVRGDIERAVKTEWAIATKAPGWEKLAGLLGLSVETIITKESK